MLHYLFYTFTEHISFSTLVGLAVEGSGNGVSVGPRMLRNCTESETSARLALHRARGGALVEKATTRTR